MEEYVCGIIRLINIPPPRDRLAAMRWVISFHLVAKRSQPRALCLLLSCRVTNATVTYHIKELTSIQRQLHLKFFNGNDSRSDNTGLIDAAFLLVDKVRRLQHIAHHRV